ncbi:MAG: guanylate kinase [Verrucomicrobiota bacterium]|jgi:guanylate kinase|nr:guanylate kinase [Verrucomicrobiota bacterium]
MTDKKKALLLVVSGPSGAGKSSLCSRLVELFPEMIYSISCTTRAPRGTEKNGIHYYFLSEEEFNARIATGAFLEHALVHGNHYGTLKQTVFDALIQGKDVVMDIDVQGAKQIRSACAAMQDDNVIKRGFVDIFIAPPSMEVLRQRLCGRSTDSEKVIEQRMRNAQEEMKYQPYYQYTVINDNFDRALTELTEIIVGEHNKRR